MLRLFVFVWFFLLTASPFLYSQDVLSFEKSVLPGNAKAKKFSKGFQSWIESQTMMEIVSNNYIDSLTARATMPFTNTVVYAGSATIARSLSNQTNGMISYKIIITCHEDHYRVRLTDFEHKPSAKGEKIEFGKITRAENAPKHLLADYDAEWCNGVWKLMKSMCNDASSEFFYKISGEMANIK